MNPLVAVATGAGISAESGVPTFRGSGGLWNGRRVEDVATPQAFVNDPENVWGFYLERRRNLLEVKPNAGHLAIAAWQERFEGLTVITQNVDGLHQRAGSKRVIELHGTIWARHCNRCQHREDDFSTSLINNCLPKCKCGELMRPSAVWFGEELPEKSIADAFDIVNMVKVLVVVGTSNAVYPAAALPIHALSAGATVIEVNPERTSLSSKAHLFIQGAAGKILPELESKIAEFVNRI